MYVERYLGPDVAMIKVAPMDNHGFFNFGTGNSLHATIAEGPETVIDDLTKAAKEMNLRVRPNRTEAPSARHRRSPPPGRLTAGWDRSTTARSAY
jgi:acyl-CoA hydrolase